MSRTCELTIHPASEKPKTEGFYLCLAYEWVGLERDKPKKPDWKVRYYAAKNWERRNYTFDTGCLENFEAVEWSELPEVKR